MPTGYKEASFKTTLTNDDSLSANALMNRQLSQPQLNNLKIPDISVIKGKTHDGSDFVKTLLAGCSGIDVQQAVPLIRHHFKDMGVATDEQPGGILLDDRPNALVVTTGIPANVRHKHINAFTVESQVLRKLLPHGLIVDVTIDSAERAESLQPIHHFLAANIAGVPDLVAFFKVLKNAFVQVRMSIGE